VRPLVRGSVYLALALSLLAAGWLGYQVYDVYTGLHDMLGQPAPLVEGEKKVAIPPINGNSRINFLILGSDNDKKKEEAHPDTQSMIVLTIDPRNKTVNMVSIPRDFWVPIKGHGMAKIDLAYHYGGVSLARYTVERLFNIPIHHWAWVGLDGFIKVIDTFGGVTLDVAHPILDDYYPDDLNSANPYGFKRVFIPPGWQYMQGAQALEYVRSRHGDKIGDFGRSSRQQQVLLQLRRHINTLDVLKNLPGLVDDLRGKVKTDLGPTELLQLAQLSKQIKAYDIHQVVLQAPTYSHYGFATNALGLQSVVFPDWNKIRPLIKSIFSPIKPPSPVRAKRTLTSSTSAVAASPTPSATPAASPTPTHTPVPTPGPHVNRLPGSLLYVQNGNISRLSPSKQASQVTTDAADPVRYSMMSLSPDGRWLTYVKFTQYASDLWVRNLQTQKAYKVTSDSNIRDVHGNLWAAWPSWSSDGKTILMSWDKQKLAVPESEARPVDLALWQLKTNGTPISMLTQPRQGAGGDTEVAVRPRSGQYVYVRWDYLTPSNQPFSQLVLNDPAKARISPDYLTPRGGKTLDPAWDPAGRRLTFVRYTNGVDEIVVAPVVRSRNGPTLGARTVIDAGRVAQPSFSPDGKWVSYLKSDGSGFSLYMERASGGPSIRISEAGSSIDSTTRPIWTK
jgi:LCP family protein required for cell wall assembly